MFGNRRNYSSVVILLCSLSRLNDSVNDSLRSDLKLERLELLRFIYVCVRAGEMSKQCLHSKFGGILCTRLMCSKNNIHSIVKYFFTSYSIKNDKK